MFFKEPLTERFFVEPKHGSSMASLEETFEAPLFLRVQNRKKKQAVIKRIERARVRGSRKQID